MGASRFSAAVVLAAATLVVLYSPTAVRAGTYVAIGCEPHGGALMPETAAFEKTGSPWVGEPCSAGMPWVRVGIRQGIAIPNTFAQWRIAAPQGLRFQGGWFQADPAKREDYQSRYLYRREGEPEAASSDPITAAGWYSWPESDGTEADQLVLQVACINSSRCFADPGRPDDTLTLVRNF